MERERPQGGQQGGVGQERPGQERFGQTPGQEGYGQGYGQERPGQSTQYQPERQHEERQGQTPQITRPDEQGRSGGKGRSADKSQKDTERQRTQNR
jgi:hypothetical protein